MDAFHASDTLDAVFDGEFNPLGTLGATVSGAVPTLIVAVADCAVAPPLSVATARKAWLPAAALVQVTL